jgi:hypothetical protein
MQGDAAKSLRNGARMADLDQLRRDMLFILTGFRYSIDRPPSPRFDADRFTALMLPIEEARIRFNARVRYGDRASVSDFAAARDELLGFLARFTALVRNDRSVLDRRYRMPVPQREATEGSDIIRFLSNREKPLSVAEALDAVQAFLVGLKFEKNAFQAALPFEQLEKLVPRQQVAPVHFDVVNNRIVVINREPRTQEADRKNIQGALEHIRESGATLVGNLERSNCDKRLLETVKELQSQLTGNANIVRIGLTNMACATMSAQFKNELPEAIVGMFSSYNTSVSLYVAQFPEWEQFTERAAAIELDDEDVARVEDTADEVIESLRKSGALADPEVPKTIEAVRQFLRFPGSSSKRAAFAMIRTIENLVSSILRHALLFVGKTTEKVTNAGSTVAASVIIGLLGIALTSATGIGPAAYRAGAPWVQQAAEIVQKQIEKMGQ